MMNARLFAARYAGHCRTCSAPIDPGDPIGYGDDDAIRCADCLRHPDATTAPAPVATCPDCRLQHRGECF